MSQGDNATDLVLRDDGQTAAGKCAECSVNGGSWVQSHR